MTVALITVIESDKVNIDSSNTNLVRYFEREAVQCFTYWRKNAGSLKDIPIYAVCVTKNTISEYTQQKFKELGVEYIENYIPWTDDFECGFYNKPVGCMLLEHQLDHDFLIHIDLDMYVLREPEIEWTNSCMVYDKKQILEERKHNDGSVIDTFNTCYMVMRRSDFIFTQWWNILRGLDLRYKEDQSWFDGRFTDLDYRKLEELSFDLLSLDVDIHNIPNSIFGETYTDLNEMTEEELSHVYFHHYHIYDDMRYNWISEIRKWQALSK